MMGRGLPESGFENLFADPVPQKDPMDLCLPWPSRQKIPNGKLPPWEPAPQGMRLKHSRNASSLGSWVCALRVCYKAVPQKVPLYLSLRMVSFLRVLFPPRQKILIGKVPPWEHIPYEPKSPVLPRLFPGKPSILSLSGRISLAAAWCQTTTSGRWECLSEWLVSNVPCYRTKDHRMPLEGTLPLFYWPPRFPGRIVESLSASFQRKSFCPFAGTISQLIPPMDRAERLLAAPFPDSYPPWAVIPRGTHRAMLTHEARM